MTYELHVAGLTRQLKLHSIGENLMIAGFVVFGDVELTVACAGNCSGGRRSMTI